MENEKNLRDNDEMEIDLLQLFYALKKKIWFILAAMIIGGGLAGAYSKFLITPQYSSTSMMYILSKETTLTSLADLQIGSQLTEDYKVIVNSRPVLGEVIDSLALDMSYEQLLAKVSIGNPTDTRILTVTVTDPDPYRAKAIVDCVAETASDYIGEIMEMIPPKIIENGTVATRKTSPSNGKNAVLGALAGMVLVCGVIVIQVIMNDTVRTEEDVERHLGLSVLASVPLREGEERTKPGHNSNGENTKSRKRRKKA